ncbi:MAG: (d)CMP kinase [Elusimicrobiota bacterium]
MKDRFIITIDGPAGAGKTTIASKLADRIGFRYVDTGSMYRAITLNVIEEDLSFSDVPAIEVLAEESDIRIGFDGGCMKIYLDGRDITGEIRQRAVTENTSLIAAIPGVRYKLAKIQRQAAEDLGKVVFDGRDMGSIVFPDADLKIYLDAGIEERARRRWQELKDRGEDINIEKLKKDITERDRRDASRGLAPLRIPENASIIDSTSLSIEEVVDKIIELLHRQVSF